MKIRYGFVSNSSSSSFIFSPNINEKDFNSYIYSTSIEPAIVFDELKEYNIKENEDIFVLGKRPNYFWIRRFKDKKIKEISFIYLYLILPSAIAKYIKNASYKKIDQLIIDIQGSGDGWENLMSNSLYEVDINQWLKNKNKFIKNY